jgi:hypothetical protein
MSERIPVVRCSRCRQPTFGRIGSGLCKPCEKLGRDRRAAELHQRMTDLLRKRRDQIDWTGYEDVKAVIDESTSNA